MSKTQWLFAVVVGCVLFCFVFFRSDIEVALADSELREGIRYLVTEDTPFTGVIIEHYEDASLKSHTGVRKGRTHGKSEAFYPNGNIQVSESFKNGISHGLRTKWYENGTKQSEGEIVKGEFDGVFRKWNENGQLVTEVEMSKGVPHGVSRLWNSDGNLELELVMENGKKMSRQSLPEGDKS